jgi:hypothetical protein
MEAQQVLCHAELEMSWQVMEFQHSRWTLVRQVGWSWLLLAAPLLQQQERRMATKSQCLAIQAKTEL